MNKPLACPRCEAILTDDEVKVLWGRRSSARRKVKAGGHGGGRPKKKPEADTALPMESRAEQIRENFVANLVPPIAPRALYRVEPVEDSRHLVPIDDL